MSCPECENEENNTYDWYEGKFLLKCGECGIIWRVSTGEVYYMLSDKR